MKRELIMFKEIDRNRFWTLNNVECWVIIEKESGNIVEPAGKNIFDNQSNALKSLYRVFSSKSEYLPYADKFEIIKIGEYKNI